MKGSTSAILEIAAQRVCSAITRHASLCSQDPGNGPAIMPAISELQDCLREYAALVIEVSGWADPICGYNRPAEDDDDENDRPSPEGGGVEADVMVFDHFFLGVEEPEILLDFASKRAGRKLESLDEAVEILCRLDGWQPQSYPGRITVNMRNVDTCFS